MAFARGRFGIEYDQHPSDDDGVGLGWVFALIGLVVLGSFVWSLVGRFRGESAAESGALSVVADDTAAESAPAITNAPMVPAVRADAAALPARPAKVKALLMRLEEAEKKGDIEMAVSTIEQLRAFPGSPVADLDDALARRLGVLNVKRLFTLRNAQWVGEVTVKAGQSATRIAAEHGSTLASLARLNGGKIDKLLIGQKLRVMDHPRFNLVVHRRSRTADLSLNGKFFKRYDLDGDVSAAAGAYTIPARIRPFWAELGLALKVPDRAELELLLPTGTSVLVSEL